MNKVKLFASLLSAIFTLSINSGKADTIPAKIWGNHPDYKNSIITAEAISDYITGTKEVVGIDTVDEYGNFTMSINLNETRFISLSLGKSEGVLYMEPAGKYEIALPPYEPVTMAEIVNPFFKPSQVYLGIKNIDSLDLNFQLNLFDDLYYKMLERYYYTIFKEPNRKMVDSLMATIDIHFAEYNNMFFNEYKKYKYAWVQYVSYKRDYRYIIRDYFNDSPIAYHNPAYMDLFNQIFTNYLSFYSNTAEGARLYSDIALAKSPKFVKETFSNNMALTENNMQEWALLKGLNDAFYGEDFPVTSLLITLDSVELTTKVPEHKICARNIRAKVMKTKKGEAAPAFELFDANGTLRNNKEFLANYVYLNFCTVQSFTCQQEFELMKKLYEKHKDEFRIISISIDNDFELAKKYFNDNGYEWMLLSYANQQDVIKKYNVRAYPTYYLINPEGNLQMSPARAPSENFEWAFFKHLQAKKTKELRE